MKKRFNDKMNEGYFNIDSISKHKNPFNNVDVEKIEEFIEKAKLEKVAKSIVNQYGGVLKQLSKE